MTGQSLPAGHPAPASNSLPLQECDLVMKGGITSGIVYPPAVKQLSSKYRFRSIGGTSVGAMAAVAIAAAEFYRQKTGSPNAFTCLDQDVKEWLKEDRHLIHLFRPVRPARPLLSFMLALQPARKGQPGQSQTGQSSPLQILGRILYALFFHDPLVFSREAIISAFIGLLLLLMLPLAILALYSLATHSSLVLSLWPLAGLMVAAVVGIVSGWQIGSLVSGVLYLPNNFYGLCTGYTPTQKDRDLIQATIDPAASGHQSIISGQSPSTAPHTLAFLPGTHTDLTDWLDYMISLFSDRQPDLPLTIGDLSQQKIELKMVTSNLSQTLSYILPEGLRNFIFKAEEMANFFPGHIIRHLILNQPDSADPDPEKRPLFPSAMLPQGYYFFPIPEKLPLLVCARFSLSFPPLLSAVPVYAIDSTAYQAHKQNPQRFSQADLHLNWFSDGGICSNFPVQFFDSWLPGRPTLGINLLTKEPSANCVTLDNEDMVNPNGYSKDNDVFLLQANARPDLEWHPIHGMLSFGSAIFRTAQNCRDITQARLPSYRERVAQIRLESDEGGLNLKMDDTLIDDVSKRGQRAGDLLLSNFDFDQHTWIRFLVLMAQLEKDVIDLDQSLIQMSNLLAKGQLPPDYLYRRGKNPPWPRSAKKRVDQLLTFVQAWNAGPAEFFEQDAPLPEATLRVTPEI